MQEAVRLMDGFTLNIESRNTMESQGEANQKAVELASSDDGDIEFPTQFLAYQNKELDLRIKEIELRRDELAIQKQENDYSYTYSSNLLEKDAVEKAESRITSSKMFSRILITLVIIVFLVLVFFGYALYLGQTAIVQKIIEISGSVVLGLAGGGGAGYYLGFRKGRKEISN